MNLKTLDQKIDDLPKLRNRSLCELALEIQILFNPIRLGSQKNKYQVSGNQKFL